jgi:predicted nucleic acid-binding Zn ribbon protein
MEKGPQPLKEILGQLFALRGWGRLQERLRLEQAWTEAAGAEFAPHTRVNGLRKGVLEVTVASAVLLQELSHFHKRRILEALRRLLPHTPLSDLRFRAGVVKK